MHNDTHADGEVVIRANANTTGAILGALDGVVKRDAIRVEDPDGGPE